MIKISQNYQGLLLDAYGVFWGGNAFGAIPGAKEAMRSFVLQGKIVGILSNATVLSKKEISKLASHGIHQGEHFHFLVTSGDIVRDLFLSNELPFPTPHKKFWLIHGNHPRHLPHQGIFQDTAFKETPLIEEADFIYIGVPHLDGEEQVDPSLFHQEIEKILPKNLPMVCGNPDRFAHEGLPPKAYVRQGSIGEMYEKMGGTVFYIGKPYPLSYKWAMNHFNTYHINDPKNILMIGDTPETDIRGARLFGMASALLTETGIMADRIKRLGKDQAIKEIPPKDIPDFYIGSLANGI